MAIQSTWFRMTPEILIEYRTDQYRMLNGRTSDDEQPRRFYIVETLNGEIVYVEDLRYTDETKREWYKNQALYQKFPAKSAVNFYHVDLANASLSDQTRYKTSELIKHSTRVINSTNNPNFYESEPHTILAENFFYDTIRIYLLRGYNLEDLDGISLKVKAEASKQIIEDEHTWKEAAEVVAADLYIDKLMLYPKDKNGVDPVHKLVSPMYMNSKYYDKYIEIEVPSLYGIALRDHQVIDLDGNPSTQNDPTFITLEFDENGEVISSYSEIYTVNLDSSIIIEFGQVVETSNRTFKIGKREVDGLQFNLTNETSGVVIPNSNSDYFNARIYETSDHSAVMYCPVYGESELDTVVMNQIETGGIPLTANSFYDAEVSYSKFNDIDTGADELYYVPEDKSQRNVSRRKWKVYNDLLVDYIYYGADGSAEIYQESYTRVIDYDANQGNNIAFWRSKFIPDRTIIKQLNAQKICLRYVCRLVNEMRGMECIRTASLYLDAYRYTDNIINSLNINTYKIINKLPDTIQNNIQRDETVKEKVIRSYYNSTNLMAKFNQQGTVYTQGKGTLYLNRSSNYYRIQLFNLTNDNTRLALDLTGLQQLRLEFPGGTGSSRILIRQTLDSERQALGIGVVMFYVSSEQAQQVMSVPADKRYFSITTDNGSTQQNTVLYEGHVEWLV